MVVFVDCSDLDAKREVKAEDVSAVLGYEFRVLARILFKRGVVV